MSIDFFYNYVGICISSSLAESITFPIDYLKTKTQINNKKNFTTRIRNTPINKLYKGLKPAVFRHFIYRGTKINIYENLRNNLSSHIDNLFLSRVIASFTAGSMSQFIANPADVLKIQMIHTSESSLIKTTKSIFRRHGMKGFYKGWQPNVLRGGAVNLGELTTYDQAKSLILYYRPKEDILTYSFSSLCSGLVSSTLSTPFDVAKTNMMSNINKYNGVVDCMVDIVKKNGVRELFNGVGLNWLRMAPWQFIFWNTYESYRKSMGLNGF